jgi:hypothetical protein
VITYHIIEYFNTKELFKQKQYQVVEGIVSNFEPMPKGGRGQESFSVGKVKFAYSDANESYYGFNQTKVYEGPIDEGKQVRISYYTKGRQNIILKLEIREGRTKLIHVREACNSWIIKNELLLTSYLSTTLLPTRIS